MTSVIAPIQPFGRFLPVHDGDPTAAQPRLRDAYGRQVTYLRVSVTEHCNLRCFYCLPRARAPRGGSDHLELDEIASVVATGVALGIGKVRLTGGEPLVRPGVVDLIRALRALPGITDLALSTNGTRLAEHAAALRAAGLMRGRDRRLPRAPSAYLTGRHRLGVPPCDRRPPQDRHLYDRPRDPRRRRRARDGAPRSTMIVIGAPPSPGIDDPLGVMSDCHRVPAVPAVVLAAHARPER